MEISLATPRSSKSSERELKILKRNLSKSYKIKNPRRKIHPITPFLKKPTKCNVDSLLEIGAKWKFWRLSSSSIGNRNCYILELAFSIYWKNKSRNFPHTYEKNEIATWNSTSSTAFFCLAEATKDLAPTNEPDIFMNWAEKEIPRPKIKRRRGFPPALHGLRLFAALFAGHTAEGRPEEIGSRRWKLRPIRLAIFPNLS